MIRHVGREWVLYTKRAPHRVLGRHSTRAGALAQERAIEASKARKENPRKPPSFKESHWGKDATDVRHVRVAEPRDNKKLIGLGVVHSIVYVTQKGTDQEPVEYEHKFSHRDPPLLAYGSDDGKLFFVGGEYYVTSHGIHK
jgi:hypothetical protein